MEKQISIIVPCYNVENYIDRCFRSIEKQTIGIDRLEIILVDDCSTDSTWEHLIAFEKRYPESVTVIRCDENGRQGKARNIGLAYATSPYIGFVDSDDWIESDMFQKLYEKMILYNSDIVMCASWRDMDCADQVLPPKREKEKDDRFLLIDTEEKRKLLLANSILEFCVWNKLYRRDFLEENHINFPENLAYEDHYFATLLYFYVKRIYILEERLYHYFVNQQSTVMSANATHHMDILSVDILLWDECEKRGLLECYREELEYQFLALCYLTSFKMLLLRYDSFPYDFFQRMKQEVIMRVPNYQLNKYVDEFVTDVYKIILELLNKDMGEEELKAVFSMLQDYIKRGMLKV